MANQILAGAVFQAGQVLAGIDADNILDTFIAPSTTSSTVANKILMWNSDYAHSVNNNGTYSGSTSQGGLFMTDAAFANPLTLSPETPQSVAAGEGKVVSISMGGEINVYNSSTGTLEATFTDTLLDNGKASDQWGTANCCVIGAGKIFINSPEHNGAGVGSIIVVDLLDRNGHTPLDSAIHFGHLDVINALLKSLPHIGCLFEKPKKSYLIFGIFFTSSSKICTLLSSIPSFKTALLTPWLIA